MADLAKPNRKSKFADQHALEAIETPGDAWRREIELRRDRRAWEQRQVMLIQRAKSHGSR